MAAVLAVATPCCPGFRSGYMLKLRTNTESIKAFGSADDGTHSPWTIGVIARTRRRRELRKLEQLQTMIVRYFRRLRPADQDEARILETASCFVPAVVEDANARERAAPALECSRQKRTPPRRRGRAAENAGCAAISSFPACEQRGLCRTAGQRGRSLPGQLATFIR
jgi:hypothetical protein